MADERVPENAGTAMGADDLREEHLRWLVQSRSRNQQLTLDLYLAIKSNSASLEPNVQYSQFAQELAAIVFSLWRAVFLSDLTENVEKRMIDATSFLGTLVSHKTIAYQRIAGHGNGHSNIT